MTEIAGKVHRSEFCSDCQYLLGEGRVVWICEGCASTHGTDMAIAVNSDKANLLVEGGSNGHGHSDVQPDTTL